MRSATVSVMTDMRWSGWGADADRMTLSDQVLGLLRQGLGVTPEAMRSVSVDEVELPDSALSSAAAEAFGAVVGADQVRTDRDARLLDVGGRSTVDLWRRRAGDASDAPDAVVLPGSHDEVLGVLRVASEHGVAVVPFGGGTSVVGGVEPDRGGFGSVVALDLRRLDGLVEVDEVSMTARLEPGLLGPRAERLLAEHGLTLGHFPQSFEYASIGGFAATRSSGQASSGYGRFDALVMGLRVATPLGTLELGSAPASAAGPDLRELVMGSEGAFGIIPACTVRVRPRPAVRVYEGWRFASFAEGADVVRRLAQSGASPTVLRLSDEAETAVNLADPAAVGGDGAGGCLLLAGYEGEQARVDAMRLRVSETLTGLGGSSLGEEPGRAWAEGRFHGPYLRDAMLDVGVLVETLETATFWSRLHRVYADVKGALEASLAEQGAPAIVLGHISHVYENGASLYFTVAAKELDDPVAEWAAAKTAASDAIVAAGATITHHHGIGRDHRPWLASEIGEVGVEILRAVKDRIDPEGVLNPGVLVP